LQAPKRAENRDFCGLLTVKIHIVNRLLRERQKSSTIKPGAANGKYPGKKEFQAETGRRFEDFFDRFGDVST
jgi:hypothetical protein